VGLLLFLQTVSPNYLPTNYHPSCPTHPLHRTAPAPPASSVRIKSTPSQRHTHTHTHTHTQTTPPPTCPTQEMDEGMPVERALAYVVQWLGPFLIMFVVFSFVVSILIIELRCGRGCNRVNGRGVRPEVEVKHRSGRRPEALAGTLTRPGGQGAGARQRTPGPLTHHVRRLVLRRPHPHHRARVRPGARCGLKVGMGTDESENSGAARRG
jgi:hypothetical protein